MSTAILDRRERDLGAMVATHERGRSLSDFQRYADDPVGFATEVLKVELWSAQRKIIESVRDHRQTVARKKMT